MTAKTFPGGVWPVVLTPFRSDFSIDRAGYEALLDYYLAHRVSGLFASCLSSELFQLSAEERLELVRLAVQRSGGRVPVVACGGFGDSLEARAASVRAMAETGVDAVVIPLGLLAEASESEEALIATFGRLLALTGEIPLGLYECPLPYHRLVSPEALARMVEVAGGRLAFLKDTCCDRGMLHRKLSAVRGTSLKIYNANLVTYLDSLRHGAAGYSGTSANFYPELLAELTECFQSDAQKAERIQRFLTLIQRHVECKYPRAAKAFLALRGVALREECRVACASLGAEDREQLQVLRDAIDDFDATL